MGTIYRIKDHEGKPQVVVTGSAVNLSAIGSDECAVFIGSSVPVHRRSEIDRAIQMAMEALREDGVQDTGAVGDVRVAEVTPGAARSTVSIANKTAATGTVAETLVAVAYGQTFDNVPHSTNGLHNAVARLRQYIQEATTAN